MCWFRMVKQGNYVKLCQKITGTNMNDVFFFLAAFIESEDLKGRRPFWLTLITLCMGGGMLSLRMMMRMVMMVLQKILQSNRITVSCFLDKILDIIYNNKTQTWQQGTVSSLAAEEKRDVKKCNATVIVMIRLYLIIIVWMDKKGSNKCSILINVG